MHEVSCSSSEREKMVRLRLSHHPRGAERAWLGRYSSAWESEGILSCLTVIHQKNNKQSGLRGAGGTPAQVGLGYKTEAQLQTQVGVWCPEGNFLLQTYTSDPVRPANTNLLPSPFQKKKVLKHCQGFLKNGMGRRNTRQWSTVPECSERLTLI